MDAGKSDLFKIQVALRIAGVLLFRRRDPTDPLEVSAVLVDRYGVLRVANVDVQRQVVELVLGAGKMDGLESPEKAVARQRRRPFKIVLEVEQGRANDQDRRYNPKHVPVGQTSKEKPE